MPGLGWMLSRKLFTHELEPQWPGPDKRWDWDMWMRLERVRRGRECVVPDISRTFHFGSNGLNVNSALHERYFRRHAINRQPMVKLVDVSSLQQQAYEQQIHKLLQSARVLDHSRSPCDTDFIGDSLPEDSVLVLYIRCTGSRDFAAWLHIARCLNLWDIDARGQHRFLWRLAIKRRQLLVVGVPQSPYS
jgi:beta-1,2-N-acetylglucosaminyltransferase